jgi:hypothetical protein
MALLVVDPQKIRKILGVLGGTTSFHWKFPMETYLQEKLVLSREKIYSGNMEAWMR